MKVKEIQERKEINLKSQNKKKQKLKEKGITLIALVVTIIILLILAGVTLNMAISGDGLFSRARNAADKYKKAQKDEQELISEIGKEMNSEYVGAYITGYTPTSGSCTITGEQSGTGATQTFTTTKEQENGNELKWKIWDYDGKKLRIILDKTTTQKLRLKGANGYNNGVWAVNEICRRCFGQYEGEKMKAGISVENLKRSDIQNVSIYDYTKYGHVPDGWQEANEEKEENDMFGEEKNYTLNSKYPTIWEDIDKKWTYEYKNGEVTGNDKECLLWETEGDNGGNIFEIKQGDENTSFKQSYYAHKYQEEEFKNSKYFKLIFINNDINEDEGNVYWLAGRSINCNEPYCCFGLNTVSTSQNEKLGLRRILCWRKWII